METVNFAPSQPTYSQPQTTVSVGDWFLTLLILFIPVVGFIMLFVWAFGSSTPVIKANFAKAALIWTVIGFALYFILFAFIGMAFLNMN
jgi:hypothetical protein